MIPTHNTAFALGMAAHAALEVNRPVLFFSLEMSHLEITQRILSAEARVDSTKMRNGRLAEADWTKLSHAIGRLAEAPLYIDDDPQTTIMEIRSKARRLKSREGDLALVVVDYLQLMTGRTSAENRQVEISEISRGLKILARELEVPVVALSQLSRQLEMRADKRPMLSDLRESGAIEQDADVVMFLYRDEIYNTDSPDRGTCEVIVSKHRSGPTGSDRLAFLDHYTRFANMARAM
jgi:replicative DNA helicase